MSSWEPQIVRIEKVERHPNAQALDIATVLGDFPVIVKRFEYQEGDLATYLPIDTIVPDTEQFHFLSPKSYEKYEENGEIKQRQIGPKYPVGSVPEKYRILKAKRILDIYSQGLLIPALPGLQVGDSVVEIMGLTKWEEEAEENIPGNFKIRGGNAAKSPKGWTIPYYDINALRKYYSCIREDEEIVICEKLEGSNASFTHDGNELWVKSRQWFRKFDEECMWWDIAIRYNLQEKLSKYPMLTFFGEIVGQVKKFRYDSEVVNGKLLTKFYLFDIYDQNTKRFLDYDKLLTIASKLDLKTAPQLYRGKLLDKATIYNYAEGNTTIGGKHVREGFVLKSTVERYEPKLNGRLQLKIHGQGYNLQK